MPNEFKLPPANVLPKIEPEARLYGFNPNPLDRQPNLEWIGPLPEPCSLNIAQSPIGIGYETLDRDTFDPTLSYAAMAKSGVKWARLQSGWMKCEKTPGRYDFSWLDAQVDALLAIGIQPWLSVSFGNPLHTPVDGYATWAADHPGQPIPHHVRGYVGEVPLYHGPAAIQAWEKYLDALARHFTGRVSHYEIWNEPNTAPAGFWQTRERYRECDRTTFEQHCARDYVELVKISARSLRRADPSAQIIGGSISLTLDACFYIHNLAAAGIAEHIDILSYHPYGLNPELALAERHQNLRRTLDAHGGRHVRLWQGECGCSPQHGFSGHPYVQAKFITRRYTADFKSGCEVSSYFMVMDKQHYAQGGVCGYGVLDSAGRPKLSYQALQAMGLLFADAEPADDLYIRINSFGTPLNSHLRLVAMVTHAFRRRGCPVFSWHVPENPDISLEPGRIDVQLWLGSGASLPEPVLIDPIRNRVYAIRDFDAEERGFRFKPIGFDENVKGFVTLYDMPFVDYPLFLTDRSVMAAG